MEKTREYLMGFITGLAIAFALYSCTNPLTANAFMLGESELRPMYVKIVK